MDSEPISALLTLAEWEELERIIEAVASRPGFYKRRDGPGALGQHPKDFTLHPRSAKAGWS
jgi:hypothetical protein